MEINKIIIIKGEVGTFAFTKDEDDTLIYQEIGDYNQFYFSTNRNEGGNLSDDWEVVDMMNLDHKYKLMVENAIKQLN